MALIRPVAKSQHGTHTGYIYGCRCAPCKAANAKASAQRRKRYLGKTPPKHNLNGYTSYGCRCTKCCTAMRDYQALRYFKKNNPGVKI